MKYDDIAKLLAILATTSITLQPIIGMLGFYLIIALEIFFWVLRILKTRKLFLNTFDKMFIIFIFLCFFSKLYAISQPTANYAIKELSMSYIISFFIGEYIFHKSSESIEKKFLKIFDSFSLSTILMSIYLLIFDLPRILGTHDRLGRIIFQDYGTYIVFSYSLIISICYLFWKFVFIKKDINTIIGFIIVFITSCFSGTRKVLVCFVIFLVLILFYKNRKNIFKILKFIFVTLICVVALYNIILNNEVLYKLMGRRIESMVELIAGNEMVTDNSIDERSLLKTLAISAFKEKPFLGWGVNNFANYSEINSGPFLYAHCNYLELLSTLGIVGTIVYYSAYFWLMKKSHKSLKNNNISIFIFFFLMVNLISDYETVSYCKIHYILVFVLFAKYLSGKEVQCE